MLNSRFFLGCFFAAVFLGASALSAQVFLDGGNVNKAFGNASVSLDTVNFSPNDTTLSSALASYAGSFNTLAFRDEDPANQIVPANVDWSLQDISFDYRTDVVDRIFNLRLLILDASDIAVLELGETIVPELQSLNTDGNWHTLTIPVSAWSAAYDTAVGNGDLNPNVAHTIRIFTQNHNTTGTINFDNFQITPVPEPSFYAALLGGVGLAIVAWRRRR